MIDSNPSSNRPRRSPRACCCAGCVLVLVLLSFPVYLALTPRKPPPALLPYEAARVDQSVSETKAAAKKIERDISAGKRTTFTLVLREAEINRMLETDNRLQNAMKREQIVRAWVSIANRRVKASAIRSGTPSSLTVTVIPEIDNAHRLKLSIEGLEVGQLGVPAVSAIRRASQKAIAMLTEKSLVPKARFESVKVEDGAITLTGRPE